MTFAELKSIAQRHELEIFRLVPYIVTNKFLATGASTLSGYIVYRAAAKKFLGKIFTLNALEKFLQEVNNRRN